jgi:hypothetical protein
MVFRGSLGLSSQHARKSRKLEKKCKKQDSTVAAEKSSHGSALQEIKGSARKRKKPHPACEQASRSFVNQDAASLAVSVLPVRGILRGSGSVTLFSPSGIPPNRLLPGN